jgi:hypothetical protein
MDRSKELIDLMKEFDLQQSSSDAPVYGLFNDLAFTLYNRDTVVDQFKLEASLNSLIMSRNLFFESLKASQGLQGTADNKE